MATLDIFQDDAFSVTSLTSTITDIPDVPTQLGQKGLFAEEGISTLSFMIERQGSSIKLLPTAARGGVREPVALGPRKLIPLMAMHIPASWSVLADEVQGIRAYAFPTMERMAGADEEQLTELGFSRRKAEYVIGVARAGVDFESLRKLPDEEVKATLTAIRGLGEWTADWFLARHLARPHAWPAGDLGLVKAVSAFYFDGRKLTIAEVREFAGRLHPFENLSAHYLLAGHRIAPPA
jgi:hypothetical protein